MSFIALLIEFLNIEVGPFLLSEDLRLEEDSKLQKSTWLNDVSASQLDTQLDRKQVEVVLEHFECSSTLGALRVDIYDAVFVPICLRRS